MMVLKVVLRQPSGFISITTRTRALVIVALRLEQEGAGRRGRLGYERKIMFSKKGRGNILFNQHYVRSLRIIAPLLQDEVFMQPFSCQCTFCASEVRISETYAISVCGSFSEMASSLLLSSALLLYGVLVE